MWSLMSFSFVEGLILCRASIKSFMQTSGHRSSEGGLMSISVIGFAAGSDGKVGVHPPSGVCLKNLPDWHLRTGIIKASLTTIEQSEPE